MGGPTPSCAIPSTRAGSSSSRASRSRSSPWALGGRCGSRARLGAQGTGRGALPRRALSGLRGLLHAHALPARPLRLLTGERVGCTRGRSLAGARRTGVLLPPRIGSRGAHPRVPRRHVDRAGRGRRGRLRARPDREVAGLRLRRGTAGRRAGSRRSPRRSRRRSPRRRRRARHESRRRRRSRTPPASRPAPSRRSRCRRSTPC